MVAVVQMRKQCPNCTHLWMEKYGRNSCPKCHAELPEPCAQDEGAQQGEEGPPQIDAGRAPKQDEGAPEEAEGEQRPARQSVLSGTTLPPEEEFLQWAPLDVDGGMVDTLKHRQERLLGVQMFQAMGGSEIDAAARVLEVVVFEPGAHIIRQGDVGNDCFIVDGGECYVEVNGMEVWQYAPGGFFGAIFG